MLISPLKSLFNVCVRQGKMQYPKILLAVSINIREKKAEILLKWVLKVVLFFQDKSLLDIFFSGAL